MNSLFNKEQTRSTRDHIDEIIHQSRYGEWRDEVLSIPGIKLIQRVDEFLSEIDCQSFLFGKESIDVANLSKLTRSIKGALVLYCDLNGNVKHVGIATRRGTIISKWGVEGHVYEHDPLSVPTSYGYPTYYANTKPLNNFPVANLL